MEIVLLLTVIYVCVGIAYHLVEAHIDKLVPFNEEEFGMTYKNYMRTRKVSAWTPLLNVYMLYVSIVALIDLKRNGYNPDLDIVAW